MSEHFYFVEFDYREISRQEPQTTVLIQGNAK